MLVIYVTDEQVETASKREATPLCRNFEHCVDVSCSRTCDAAAFMRSGFYYAMVPVVTYDRRL